MPIFEDEYEVKGKCEDCKNLKEHNKINHFGTCGICDIRVEKTNEEDICSKFKKKLIPKFK